MLVIGACLLAFVCCGSVGAEILSKFVSANSALLEFPNAQKGNLNDVLGYELAMREDIGNTDWRVVTLDPGKNNTTFILSIRVDEGQPLTGAFQLGIRSSKWNGGEMEETIRTSGMIPWNATAKQLKRVIESWLPDSPLEQVIRCDHVPTTAWAEGCTYAHGRLSGSGDSKSAGPFRWLIVFAASVAKEVKNMFVYRNNILGRYSGPGSQITIKPRDQFGVGTYLISIRVNDEDMLSGGWFELSESETLKATRPLLWNASPQEMKDALEGLSKFFRVREVRRCDQDDAGDSLWGIGCPGGMGAKHGMRWLVFFNDDAEGVGDIPTLFSYKSSLVSTTADGQDSATPPVVSVVSLMDELIHPSICDFSTCRFNVTNLQSGTGYFFRVRAKMLDQSSSSSWSQFEEMSQPVITPSVHNLAVRSRK